MRNLFFLVFLSSLSYAISYDAIILDARTKQPVANATICDADHCIDGMKNGSFVFDSNKKVHIKAIGYRPYTIKRKQEYYLLEPIKVKALYLTFWGASPYSKTFKNALKLIDQTQFNSIVVDIKNEYGNTSYKTDIKKINDLGVYKKRTIKDIKKFMDIVKSKNIYMIARIVVFKDHLQAMANQDYAIYKDGKIWTNHDKMAWVDPFDKRSWKYVVDIAEDAAKKGFDEINFDYIRFPAKKGLTLSQTSTQQSRTKTIAEFLEYAKKRLQRYGVFISVDTYGNILWSKDDNNIGQTVEVFAKHADYLCPMLYPSGFSYGSFHFDYPAAKPYEVYERSIRHIKDKIDVKKLRPWIQAFRDYRKKRLHYDRNMIQAQIKACDEKGTNGWMAWSPSSKYKIENFQ